MRKDKEIMLFWSHHQTQLFRIGYHPRNLIRKEENQRQLGLNNIIQWTDIHLKRILRVTDNRNQWRTTIHGVINPWIEDD